MLGSHSQSVQLSTEKSRPKSRLLAMKERLRLQRQRTRHLSSGNCRHDEAEQCPPSTVSGSNSPADCAQASPSTQSPVKGRRFQRSRHAEQQARSRSQDAVTTTTKKDGLFGCAVGARPLQKSKSVDMNLEKIVPEARHSNTVSVEVEKLAASGGSRKVEKKGSFLFRSSSLLARLSGRSGQKKMQSPSPLRREVSQSASVENPDDSVGASVNQSVASSASSKTASLSESGRFEGLTAAEIEGTGSDCQQQLKTTLASTCHPSAVQNQSGEASCPDLESRRGCDCSAFVKSSRIPLSRAPHPDSKCREKAAALEHGSEIVLAAETRRGLQRQMSEDWVAHSKDHCGRPHVFNSESETGQKLTVGGQGVSICSGDLLKTMPQVRDDLAGCGVKSDVFANTSTKSSVAATAPRDPKSFDAVTTTTTCAHEQHSEYS